MPRRPRRLERVFGQKRSCEGHVQGACIRLTRTEFSRSENGFCCAQGSSRGTPKRQSDITGLIGSLPEGPRPRGSTSKHSGGYGRIEQGAGIAPVAECGGIGSCPHLSGIAPAPGRVISQERTGAPRMVTQTSKGRGKGRGKGSGKETGGGATTNKSKWRTLSNDQRWVLQQKTILTKLMAENSAAYGRLSASDKKLLQESSSAEELQSKLGSRPTAHEAAATADLVRTKLYAVQEAMAVGLLTDAMPSTEEIQKLAESTVTAFYTGGTRKNRRKRKDKAANSDEDMNPKDDCDKDQESKRQKSEERGADRKLNPNQNKEQLIVDIEAHHLAFDPSTHGQTKEATATYVKQLAAIKGKILPASQHFPPIGKWGNIRGSSEDGRGGTRCQRPPELLWILNSRAEFKMQKASCLHVAVNLVPRCRDIKVSLPSPTRSP